MSLKKLIAAAAVCACGTSFAQLGPFGPGVVGPIVDNTAVIIGGTQVSQSVFDQTFDFTLTTASSAAATVSDYPVADGYSTSLAVLAFTDLSDVPLTFAGAVDTNPADGLLVAGALDAGTYRLHVVGGATGTLGGYYAGVIQVTSVPEPATCALLLAGVMFIGGAARLRRG